MKNNGNVFLLAALSLLVFVFLSPACNWEEDEEDDDYSWDLGDDEDDLDDFLSALPDEESLTLSLPEGAKSGGKGLGELATFYDITVDFTRDVNEHVLMFLSWIDEITSYRPTSYENGTFVWGPWKESGLSPVEARFAMTLVADYTYDYQLQWRPKDTSDEWSVIWDGHVEASASTARRGVGDFSVDFTTAQSLDPTMNEEGTVAIMYDTLTDGREINVQYISFYNSEDDMAGPLDGDYAYHNHADNTGTFLFDWMQDMHYDEYGGTQYAQVEHAWFNTQWQSGGAGRCDVIVEDGDVPTIPPGGMESIDHSECWGSDFLRSYYIMTAQFEGSQTVVEEEGDESTCVFDVQMPEK